MEERKHHLEGLIESWELELGSQKSLTEDNILELSSHLRDHVDELLERNLTEEEAFAIARYQLGEVGEIEEEYRKVNINESTSKVLVNVVTAIFLFIGFGYFQLIPVYFILIIAKNFDFSIESFYFIHSSLSIIFVLSTSVFLLQMVKKNWLSHILVGARSMLLVLIVSILLYHAFDSISSKFIKSISHMQYWEVNAIFEIKEITHYHMIGYICSIILIVVFACFKLELEGSSSKEQYV